MKENENVIKRRGIQKSHSSRLMEMPVVYQKSLCEDYEVRSVEQVVDEDGIMVNKSCVKIVHPQDNFKGFKASDFALENIIAVGAVDSLKECILSGNVMDIADGLESSIDNIISAVDNLENGDN